MSDSIRSFILLIFLIIYTAAVIIKFISIFFCYSYWPTALLTQRAWISEQWFLTEWKGHHLEKNKNQDFESDRTLYRTFLYCRWVSKRWASGLSKISPAGMEQYDRPLGWWNGTPFWNNTAPHWCPGSYTSPIVRLSIQTFGGNNKNGKIKKDKNSLWLLVSAIGTTDTGPVARSGQALLKHRFHDTCAVG